MKSLFKTVLLGCLTCICFSCGLSDREKRQDGPKVGKENQTSVEMEGPSLNPNEWLTLAESTSFKATSNYEQTLDFLRRIDERMPEMKLTSFGRSAEGRELPLVILGDFDFSPGGAASSKKPVILIQNGIHPGEIDGKDACLMILRDLLFGKRRWILDKVILLIVPIYNVDGHERVSPNNRPNQDGPFDGMGFRATTQGLDLNRDHLKLVSPEARALVALFNEWRPHLHVDNHVTDGCDHDWVLTYAWAEKPQIGAPIHNWLWTHMPKVLSTVEKMGHGNGPYVWLNDLNDPSKGFTTEIGPPRLSTSYYALRNRPSILVETHSYKPYEKRVMATRDFLVELIREVEGSSVELDAAVRATEKEKTELGAKGAVPSEMTLSYKTPDKSDLVNFPIYKSRLEPSIVSSKPLIRYERGVRDDKEVPWFHAASPDKTISRPRGYLVLRGWPAIEQRLVGHGLELYVLKESIEIEVETIRLKNPKLEKSSYQGEVRAEVDTERQMENRVFPAGTIWIPADQPDFEVAAQLLEPEAPDSLVQWGMLLSVNERKSYIGPQVLENRVKELLEDPETKKAWEEALKDKAFAKDERARYIWWYKRTKHWDEQVGLLPAMRVMVKPNLVIERWEPGGI